MNDCARVRAHALHRVCCCIGEAQCHVAKQNCCADVQPTEDELRGQHVCSDAVAGEDQPAAVAGEATVASTGSPQLTTPPVPA